MREKRSGVDRRHADRGGRRAGEKLSASVLWELADGTRCWIVQNPQAIVVHISRGRQDLRVQGFDSDVTAREAALQWRLAYDEQAEAALNR
jgi:hypothetical protein